MPARSGVAPSIGGDMEPCSGEPSRRVSGEGSRGIRVATCCQRKRSRAPCISRRRSTLQRDPGEPRCQTVRAPDANLCPSPSRGQRARQHQYARITPRAQPGPLLCPHHRHPRCSLAPPYRFASTVLDVLQARPDHPGIRFTVERTPPVLQLFTGDDLTYPVPQLR